LGIVLPKPNEIIGASVVNPRILLLYSEPKAGKTELCLALPNSLLIDLEKGSDYATGTKVSANDLEDLMNIGRAVIKANRPYDYIIVDTATELESWCEKDATDMYKNSVVGKNFSGTSVLELAKGSGYYWLRKSYGKWFESLATWPRKCLILLAHVKDKMIVDKKGREVSASDLDLTGKLKQITCSKADAIGYLYRKNIGAEEGKSVDEIRISFSSGEVNSGSRPKHLSGQDFSMSKVVKDSSKEKIEVAWDKIFIGENK
jgi:hypothetical protein